MHSLNLFIYNQEFFLEKEKNNLKNLCKQKNYHFLFYSIQINNYLEIAQNIAKELYTSSFFYDKKILFIENLSLLMQKQNINLNFLLNFFEKPQENIILYLAEEKDNNFTSDIQEQIYKNFHIYKKNKLSCKDLFKYTKEQFTNDGFIINSEIVYFIIHTIKNNLFLLKEEIQKIKLYHLSTQTKEIKNLDIIKKLIFYHQDENIFSFIKSVLNDDDINKKNIHLLCENLINKKKDPVLFIYQILNKLQGMLLIKHLIIENKKENEISNILQYPIEKAFFLIKEIKLLPLNKIENLFSIFFDLYYKFKKEIIKNENNLKYLLINIISNL